MVKLYFGVMIFAAFNIICSFSDDSKKKTNENKECKTANIDLNQFYNANGYEVSSGKNKYFLNICGAAPQCGEDVAVCQVLNKGKQNALGYYRKLTLLPKYKIIPGIKYATNTKKSNYSVIEFKCNRHLSDHRIQFVPKSKQGKEHTFLFESPAACPNLPTNCEVRNVDDNTEFDLRPLYKHDANWNVTDVPTGTSIYLNICGALNPLPNLTDNECLYPGTSICAVTGNQSENLGIFSSEWNTKDGLSITFTDGSACMEDRYKSTTIEFHCNFDQLQPKFVSASACETRIEWYTPMACPYYKSENKNCKIDDHLLGVKNITLDPSEPEQTVDLDESTTLKFNTCGVLSEPCNGYRNVSFCLIKQEEKENQAAVGWTNNTITVKNGVMHMQVFGSKCARSKRSVVNVEFRCNYAPKVKPKINMSSDMCKIDMVLFTNSSCLDSEPKNQPCKISMKDGSYYDLSPLTLSGSNYEIQDPNDPTLVYILNVCLPVIYSASSSCDQYSTVCVRNNTEPNFTKRFKTIGSDFASRIEHDNERLFIEHKASGCFTGKETEYTTRIEFQCANQSVQETGPKLLSKSNCQHNFIWTTRYACLQHNATTILTEETSTTTEKSNRVTDLTNSVFEKNLKIENDIKKESAPDTHAANILHVSVDKLKNATHSVNNTAVVQSMTPKEVPNGVKDHLNEQDTDKKTNESPMQSENNVANAMKNRTVLIVPVDVMNTTGISIKNCTLTDNNTDFNMHSLPKIINVTSISGRRYSVHICKSPKNEKCTSTACPHEHEDRAILSNVHIVKDKHSVDMQFQGHQKCNTGFFNSTIFMKCDHQTHEPSILKEDDCTVQLEWKNVAACKLIDLSHRNINPLPSTHDATTVPIVATVVVFLCILVAFATYYVWMRRCRKINSSPVRCYDRVGYTKNTEYMFMNSCLEFVNYCIYKIK
ncbi:lysosomal enzyme receptor protein [Carabus blaptoides fortunei]